MKIALVIVCCAATTLAVTQTLSTQGSIEAVTPAPLVAAYESLADAILATKKTEENLVHSILATTYRHAEGMLAAAKAKLAARQAARTEIETLAALVAQLGNEGDAAVAGVRKRLLEGGHHHNAAGEQQGIYDEGFVIVTRAAKKVLLEAAGKIGKAADAATLDQQWQLVESQFKELCTGATR
ncbi:MAG: hypothetical protein AB1486_06865 [Planctomycetota bacterium]